MVRKLLLLPLPQLLYVFSVRMACFKKEGKSQRSPHRSLKITNLWDGKRLICCFFFLTWLSSPLKEVTDYWYRLDRLLVVKKAQEPGLVTKKKKVQEFWTDRRCGNRQGSRSLLFQVEYTAAFLKDLFLK